MLGGTFPINLILDGEQQFSLETHWRTPADSARIEGSLDNQLYFEYQQFEQQLRREYAEFLGPNSVDYESSDRVMFRQMQEARRKARREEIMAAYPKSIVARVMIDI